MAVERFGDGLFEFIMRHPRLRQPFQQDLALGRWLREDAKIRARLNRWVRRAALRALFRLLR